MILRAQCDRKVQPSNKGAVTFAESFSSSASQWLLVLLPNLGVGQVSIVSGFDAEFS
jgi:hypothetical protein